MKWSHTALKTLRENPRGSVLISQSLLIRAGFVKKLSQGIFTYSPFLLRSIEKLKNLIRRELNKHQAVEILMPFVHPRELWMQSGRWDLYRDLLQKMTNRTGQEFCLGPTHEEAVVDYAKTHIKSYKDLPVTFYQIQTKFRDEIRPRFGLLRAKEFIMKDAYSFDLNEEQARGSYQKMRQAYENIFSSLGLSFRMVSADSGEIGGQLSEEFHILADSGEDELLVTPTFATNRDRDGFRDKKAGDAGPDGQPFQSCRGIEVGHIFYLGDKYSKKMSLFYTDQKGQRHFPPMGCYGIGITRTLQAAIEQNFDKNGMIWPVALTPFQVHICVLDPLDPHTARQAEGLASSLDQKGIDHFTDDRQEKPGVKFKDADLMGFPLRIDIGAKDPTHMTWVERKTGTKKRLTRTEILNLLPLKTHQPASSL